MALRKIFEVAAQRPSRPELALCSPPTFFSLIIVQLRQTVMLNMIEARMQSPVNCDTVAKCIWSGIDMVPKTLPTMLPIMFIRLAQALTWACWGEGQASMKKALVPDCKGCREILRMSIQKMAVSIEQSCLVLAPKCRTTAAQSVTDLVEARASMLMTVPQVPPMMKGLRRPSRLSH